jgi:Fic family protein
MKIPPIPPDIGNTLDALTQRQGSFFTFAVERSNIVDEKGRYQHWDEFRFQKPLHGLSAKEWWALTRLARNNASTSLLLIDEKGKKFSYCEPPSLRAALRELDMNAGGTLASDAITLSAEEGRLHLTRSLAEEPFASSFIEGAATTRQIAKKLIFEGRAPRTKDERMVLNNFYAMEFVKAHRHDDLTIAMLLELHRIVTEDTLDSPEDSGRIRTGDDIRVVDETSGEILHQPPPASAMEERLKKLLDFANRREADNDWLHPLIKAFTLHFMLAYEHPFVDGNGRVARALFYWAALRANYWLIEYVSISSVIAEAKIRYGKTFLYVETDENDLTYFFVYHAEILREALKRLAEFAGKKREEIAAFEKRLSDKTRPDAFNRRQSWLLNEFMRHRLAQATIAEHEKLHNVSYLTARADLENLVEQHLLRKSKNGRTSIYRPVKDLADRLTGE